MSDVKTPPRKLVDLNPKFVGVHGTERKGVALVFDCPCMDPKCGWGGSIIVTLLNPMDGGSPVAWTGTTGGTTWKRTGDTFETITLDPSIHCVGHWHGWLRNGELISC